MKFIYVLLLAVITTSSLSAQTTPEPFIVGIKQTPPFTIKTEDGKWEGPAVWLIEQILSRMGKTPTFKEMTLPQIFDAIENNKIDAGVGALSITSEREERMDFTHSYYESGIGIAVLNTDTEMWILVLRNIFSVRFLQAVFSLLLLLGIVGLIVWLAERKHNRQQFGGRPAQGIGNGLWWSAVTMTTVGYGDKAPKSFLGRIIGLVWMFMAIIIISGFTAGFASSLTRDSLTNKVQEARDLASVKTATIKGSTSATWLATLRIPYRTSSSIESLLKELDQGKWDAVVYDKPVLEYYVAIDNLHRVDILKATFTRENYGIALPQHAPYREKFDVTLLELTQSTAWQDQLYQVTNR